MFESRLDDNERRNKKNDKPDNVFFISYAMKAYAKSKTPT